MVAVEKKDGLFQKMRDGWNNVVTGLGMQRDKRYFSQLAPAPVNTSYQQYENLFVTDDIAATIAELPAWEMIRE